VHYRKILLILCSLICCSSQAYTLPSLKVEYQAAVQRAWDAANERVSFCRSLRERKSDWYDLWLLSQSDDIKRKTLHDLARMADNKCYGEAMDTYSAALIRLVAETGEKGQLEEWLILIKERSGPVGIQFVVPEEEYKHQLLRLSALPDFNQPFSVVNAYNAIIPDSEWQVEMTVRQASLPVPDGFWLRYPYFR
jgi:hypothetical protein